MRVLFVFPDLSSTVTDYSGALSYGVGLLAATLRLDGHEPLLYHMTREPSEEEFRDRIRAARPDLVAISAISNYARRLAHWSRWAHEASGAPVAVGGVHATFAPDEVSAIPEVSFTCVGEGEEALRELCRVLERGGDPTSLASFWVRRGDGVTKNPPRAIVEDLDSLPDPDLSLFDVPNLYSSRLGIFTYLMSRGCGFCCTYCAAHGLGRLAPRTGHYWRFPSPERAVGQLGRLLEKHLPDARMVTFVDAIFFRSRDWLAEFGRLYRERIGLPVSCNLRADQVDQETARMLRDIGVRIVRMGVESGDEHMTRVVLKRHLGVDDLRRAYRLLREHGIERWSYNMVGLPTETLRMALETVKLNAEIDPDLALAFIFYPYPGTALHRMCHERGWLTRREFDHYKVGVAIRQPQFRDGDVLFVHRHFQRLIRAYRWARRLPPRLAGPVTRGLDASLTSPLLPRAAIVWGHEAYRRARHAVGERLARRWPLVYRALGGRAPASARTAHRHEGMARADA